MLGDQHMATIASFPQTHIVDASMVPIDNIRPSAVSITQTVTRDGDHRQRQQTLLYSSGDQLNGEVEKLKSELAAYRMVAHAEFASEQAAHSAYEKQLKVEAVCMLRNQQAESSIELQQHQVALHGVHQQAHAYQQSISTAHDAANQLYAQGQEQQRRLEQQVLDQQRLLQEQAMALGRQQLQSPEPTHFYTTPPSFQAPQGASSPLGVPTLRMDTDDDIRNELVRSQARNEKLMQDMASMQNLVNSVTQGQARFDDNDHGQQRDVPLLPSSSPPPDVSMLGDQHTTTAGRILRGEHSATHGDFGGGNAPDMKGTGGRGGLRYTWLCRSASSFSALPADCQYEGSRLHQD